jgi:hypothetical protein
MIDELSQRYGGMLSGSHDCVDWIVLSAAFSLGHNSGGFVPGGVGCTARMTNTTTAAPVPSAPQARYPEYADEP